MDWSTGVFEIPECRYPLDETLNKHFVNFWSSHKRYHNCGVTCSKAFVTDGFQKPGRFICGNVKTTVFSEELGK